MKTHFTAIALSVLLVSCASKSNVVESSQGDVGNSQPNDTKQLSPRGGEQRVAELGFVPTVWFDEAPDAPCSRQNQKFTTTELENAAEGYTCLELLFGTNRSLASIPIQSEDGSYRAPDEYENPAAYFLDDRFKGIQDMPVPDYYREPAQNDKNNRRNTRKTVDTYQQGVAYVTVPRRKPGELISQFKYERGFLFKRKRSPKIKDLHAKFTFYDYALLGSDEFWTRAEEISSLATEADLPDWRNDQNSVLVFVHGFNVSFASAAYRTAQLTYDLNYAGLPMFFSWPASSVGGVPGILSYFNDTSEGVASVGDLKQFLLDINDRLNPSTFILVSHSHGNQIVLNALNEIAAERTGATDMFDVLIFASPDVDEYEFQRINDRINSIVRSKTLYASQDDKGNGFRTWLTRLGRSKAHAKFRAGLIPTRGERAGVPVTASGVHSIDVTKAKTGSLGDQLGINEVSKDNRFFRRKKKDKLRHSIYADASDITCDIRLLINDVVRRTVIAQPDRRSPFMSTHEGENGPFWRFEDRGNRLPSACR